MSRITTAHGNRKAVSTSNIRNMNSKQVVAHYGTASMILPRVGIPHSYASNILLIV